MNAREQLAGCFDHIASYYDEVRPRYTVEQVGKLLAYSGVKKGSRILEVGAGTGQLTILLAARGSSVCALEPGAKLAAILTEKCGKYPNVEVCGLRFEDFKGAAQSLDLIVSAEAFHWIEPAFGLARSHELLKRGGTFAALWYYDDSEGSPFWEATQVAYEKYQPKAAAHDIPLRQKVARFLPFLRNHPDFSEYNQTEWNWDLTYSTAEYAKLLATYSSTQALDEERRREFVHEISEIVDGFGGSVTKRFKVILAAAKTR